jgi:V/A-type H+-transporting ATPase subunit K
MMTLVAAIVLGAIPMIPAVRYFLRDRRESPAGAAQSLVLGLKGFNVIIGLMAAGVGFASLIWPSTVMAAGLSQQPVTSDPYASLAAAISTGLASIGAAIAVGSTGSAAVGTIAEKPEAFGRALIFVGLSEGIAIYGLIISFMVLNR